MANGSAASSSSSSSSAAPLYPFAAVVANGSATPPVRNAGVPKAGAAKPKAVANGSMPAMPAVNYAAAAAGRDAGGGSAAASVPAAAGATAAQPTVSSGVVVVRMRGLPYQATHADIVEFFRNIANSVEMICICLNYQGAPQTHTNNITTRTQTRAFTTSVCAHRAGIY